MADAAPSQERVDPRSDQAPTRRIDRYALTWRLPIIVWQLAFFVGPLLFMIAMSFFLVKN